MTTKPNKFDIIAKIAKRRLGLNTQDMDSLDFKKGSAWDIEQALLDAYDAGFEAALDRIK